MKGQKLKVSIITNSIIAIIIMCVLSVSLISQSVSPISSEGQTGAIYNGDRSKPYVSLMFNVYENTQVVEAIIQELDKRGLKATFFLGGCWADDNEKTLKKLVESGHEIANHGYFHKDHKKLSYEKNVEEIRLTGSIIKALSGVTPTLFAPPSGSYSNDTLLAASELNYKVIMWSKDTIDWRDSDVDLIVKRATVNTTNGDLVLMHPKQHSLKALPKILDYYEKIGLKQVKVSQNIGGLQSTGENNDIQ